MGIVNTGYSGSFFVPTIIREMGYTSASAQIRSIPIFVVAAICSLIAAWLTDRLRHRFSFCIFGLVVASMGYIMLLCQTNLTVGVKYFALFLVVPGGYITQPIVLAWVQNCMSGHYKRSVSAAMTVGFGNLGGIVASNVFFTEEAPLYRTGYGVGLGFLWICGLGCVVLCVGVILENKKRDRLEAEGQRSAGLKNAGDDDGDYLSSRMDFYLDLMNYNRQGRGHNCCCCYYYYCDLGCCCCCCGWWWWCWRWWRRCGYLIHQINYGYCYCYYCFQDNH